MQFNGEISLVQDSEFIGNTSFDSLYVHIPFCFHKCHYCDFYSLAEPSEPDKDRQPIFAAVLTKELQNWTKNTFLKPKTIFVGGGTPTLLRPKLWQSLLTSLHEQVNFSELVEFTVEANPETITAELLDVLVAGGVNRISIGGQSFDPSLLKVLERWHDPANVPRAAQLARTAGIRNVNVDLIFAIPGQNMAQLENDIQSALSIEPEHISYYGLTYEPNTAMTQRLKQNQFMPIDEQLETDMFLHLMDRLTAAGYEQYEISNWAKPGYRCEHNLIYWRNGNWLGVGPSAASHADGRRWKNLANIGRYLEGDGAPPVADMEVLNDDQRLGEYLMLGLRLKEGVDCSVIPSDNSRHAVIQDLVRQNLLEYVGQNIRLTSQGLLLADAVIEQLL